MAVAGVSRVAVRCVGLIEFFRQVNRERKKVTWLTFKENLADHDHGLTAVGLTMVFFRCSRRHPELW
ncbi:MAG: preprotein translocase subunit SecE [Alphaproteobacteria bacterium]|nr:preprotein translocase subunit SecE [Alphaproteobacteria bacterium]